MSDQPKVEIVTEVNADPAKAGLADLNAAFTATRDVGAKAGNEISKSFDKIRDSAKDSNAATKNLLNQIERASVASATGGPKSPESFATVAKQRGADQSIINASLAEYAKHLNDASGAAEVLDKKMLGNFTTVKGLNAALRQVPAQLTDIVVGLQGGQAPLTVLLQQGGQLKDVFGGVVPAIKALGTYVLGLVNPYTLLAAAIGTVAFLYYKASAQVEAFSNALILSGRAAGSTASELEDIAFNLSKISKVSLGTSAAALADFVASGRFGAQNIQLLTQAAIELEKRGGPAVKATRDEFIALAKDPVAASLKLNEATNYLTRSLADQIRTLEENGHAVKAGELAQKAYADAILSRSSEIKDNLGAFKRLFKEIGEAASAAGSAAIKLLDDFGKTRTPEQRIKELQNLRAGAHIGTSTTDIDAEIAQQQEVLSLNRKATSAADAAAAAKDREAKATQRRNVFIAEQIKNESAEQKLARELKEARGRNADDIRDKIITPKEARDLESAIRLRNAKTGQDNQLDKAKAAFDVGELQRALELELDTYANYDKQLEALRASGKISDANYYIDKKVLIELRGEAENAALADEIAREEKRSASGKTFAEKEIARYDALTQISKISAKLRKGEQDRAGQVEVLATQEQEAIEKRTRSIKEAASAQEFYIQTTIRGYEREIEALDKGDRERTRLAKVNSIEDKFANERKQLESQKLIDPKADTPEGREKYAEKEANLADSLRRELALYGEHYANLLNKEGDWVTGATRAFNQYQEQAANVASTTENLFTGAFKQMEDSLVNFVTSGKLSFSNLTDYILAELTRIIIKQQLSNALAWGKSQSGGDGLVGLIGSGLSVLLGGGSSTPTPIAGSTIDLGAGVGSGLGFRASGGSVSAGGKYQVNEQGPELLTTGGATYLMMGAQGGTVTPNSAIGGKTINVTINQSFGGNTSRATTLQAASDASRQLAQAGRNL